MSTIRYRLRRLHAVAVTLAFAFLFAQTGILLHDISHVGKADHDELVCHLYVAGDHKQPATDRVTPALDAEKDLYLAAPILSAAVRTTLRSAHRVRAPPLVS